MNKLKKILFNLLYSLPFGLKGADLEIMGANATNTNGETSINQQVEDKRVSKHLLNGEITQAVEELRYRTYKVDEESRNYQYLGNGVAVKKDEKPTISNKTKFKFTQRNRLMVSGVLEELERVGSYGQDNYAIEIIYGIVPKFRLEEFADRVIVNSNTENNDFHTTLVFSTIPNPQNKTSKAFVNELNKLSNIDLSSQYAVSHNMFLSDINSISFSTYKADGEEDFVNYAFLNACTPERIEFKNSECHITYKWGEMMRVPLGKLSEKYNSDSMRSNYDNHTEKKYDETLEEVDTTNYCEICGKPYEESKIPGVCNECFAKMNLE